MLTLSPMPVPFRSARSRVLALLLAAAACSADKGRAEAEAAVRTYLVKVVEAYRTGSIEPVDPLVADDHGRRLLGLIGVKQDAGVVLDAKLLDLQFVNATQQGDGWLVETKERWYYADRKIGTGQQVGQDSTDAYDMRYRFVRKDGKLLLEELEFATPPVVGRTSAPTPTDVRILHGLPSAEEETAAKAAEAAPGARPVGPKGIPVGHPETPAAPPLGHPPVPPGAGRPGAPSR